MIPLSHDFTHETASLRREGCAKYRACLDRAARAKYQNFSCATCRDYADGTDLDVADFVYKDNRVYPETPDYQGNILKLYNSLSAKMKELGIKTQNFKGEL